MQFSFQNCFLQERQLTKFLQVTNSTNPEGTWRCYDVEVSQFRRHVPAGKAMTQRCVMSKILRRDVMTSVCQIEIDTTLHRTDVITACACWDMSKSMHGVTSTFGYNVGSVLTAYCVDEKKKKKKLYCLNGMPFPLAHVSSTSFGRCVPVG